MIENEHVGNFFSGQFFSDKPDKEYFTEQAREFGFDEKKYLAALENTPVYSEEQIRKTANFLVRLTISLKAWERVKRNPQYAVDATAGVS